MSAELELCASPRPAGYYLRASRLGLRELLAQFDSDGDGGLDPLDTRRLVAEVLPGASSAQIVYIRVRG